MIRLVVKLFVAIIALSHVFLVFPIHALTLYSAVKIEGAGNASEISAAGQVVGQLFNGHAFFWAPGCGIFNLGTFGGERSRALGINESGQVVGVADSIPTWENIYDDVPLTIPFLWESDTGMIKLDVLGSADAFSAPFPEAINDQGQVVVSVNNAMGGLGYNQSYVWHPEEGAVNLGALTYGTEAFDINNSGQVAGQSVIETWDGAGGYDSYTHAIFWSVDTGMIDLGTLGGEDSFASAINDSAQVVGNSQVDKRVTHAFIWDEVRGMRDLGTLGGDLSKATGINDSGQVVGFSEYAYLGDFRAVLWEKATGIVDLNSRLINTPSPVTLVEALAINNTGQIVARGLSEGVYSIYVLTPIQAPFAKFEAGEVAVDHHWVQVNFSHFFSNPVVIVQMTSKIGNQPSVLRIRDVDHFGFTLRVQEYEYLDGYHSKETVNFMVMEQGVHTLADGGFVEAGSFETNATLTPASHALECEFANPPVIMTSITTNNGNHAVTGRVDKVSMDSFEYRMQEQEASLDGQHHVSETVAYFAWQPGDGETGNMRYSVGMAGHPISHRLKSIVSFDQHHGGVPFVFADMQTTNEPDTATLSRITSETDVFVHIDEETSLDQETKHIGEAVGYIVLSVE